MTIDLKNFDELPHGFHVYKRKSQDLSLRLLEKVSSIPDIRLKMQKASLHLLKGISTFAVIGLRRSKESIFCEFFVEEPIKHPRISKIVTEHKKWPIARIEISDFSEIDLELENFIYQSYTLI